MDRRVVSRRDVLGAGAVAVGGAIAVPGVAAGAVPESASNAAPVAAVDRTAPQGDLVLHNGKIRTFDDRDRTVSAVGVSRGRIVGAGLSLARLRHLVSADVKVIDLRGHTVIPGMIEAHVHFVSLAIRPGHHVVIENAGNIAGIQALLAARRRGVPEGRFVTAMGGWHPNMFAERRLPTLAELDAAVPDRPVLLFQGFSGPAVTNSAGRRVLGAAEPPVAVGADGSIAAGANATAALHHVRLTQTFEDRRRSTLDAMAYAASVGVTSVQDQVGFPVVGPPTPGQLLSNFDHYRMYDSWLALHREGRALIRLQANFLHNQNDIELPELTQRLNNQFQLFGDDVMMTGGIGEWGAPGDGSGPVWARAQELIARAGWRNTNRALSLAALEAEIAGYEAVNAQHDITGLRWRIDHVPVVTGALLDRLHALGGAVQCGAFSYVSGGGPAAGAPFRTILDHGIKAGIHLDGVHIAPLNPWYGVYYAVTGRNALGGLINDGQQITRDEAVRLYTRENAWFLNMEDRLGTIENGKLGDLVVLDRDYRTVGDEDLKRIRPLLTTVGGEIVYDSGKLTRRR